MGVVKQAVSEKMYHEDLEEELRRIFRCRLVSDIDVKREMKEALLGQGFDPNLVDTMSISFPSKFSPGRPVND